MVMKNQTAGNDGKTGLLRRLAMTEMRDVIGSAVEGSVIKQRCFDFAQHDKHVVISGCLIFIIDPHDDVSYLLSLNSDSAPSYTAATAAAAGITAAAAARTPIA